MSNYVGDGTADKEWFIDWWCRNEREIDHLHPQLAEQWIYRHWQHTDFGFLPVETFEWSLIEMSGEEILAGVRREISKRLDPEFDYNQFQGSKCYGRTATGRDLDSGTWEYPIGALFTPSGWVTQSESYPHEFVELPNEQLMLLEGHQRHR